MTEMAGAVQWAVPVTPAGRPQRAYGSTFSTAASASGLGFPVLSVLFAGVLLPGTAFTLIAAVGARGSDERRIPAPAGGEATFGNR
ncbi:hypothetical protein ACFQZU_20135 [Streptomonospora algeriensis]|uniref:Major facilitator superfamily (MFS) profile domain-containing protein n=1 Tax=Streptomonospora algeriensis TaxID=995084 RepID=A0ABW3BM39_9ACTN